MNQLILLIVLTVLHPILDFCFIEKTVYGTRIVKSHFSNILSQANRVKSRYINNSCNNFFFF